jgi:hypothetical protein
MIKIANNLLMFARTKSAGGFGTAIKSLISGGAKAKAPGPAGAAKPIGVAGAPRVITPAVTVARPVGAPIAPRPTTGDVVFAQPRARSFGDSQAVGVARGIRGGLTPVVQGAGVAAGAGIGAEVLNATHDLNETEQQATQRFLEQGQTPEEAARLGNKLTWGNARQSGMELLSNPLYYTFGGGGSNPIDQRFAQGLRGSFLPSDPYTAARETTSTLLSGSPASMVGHAIAYPAINYLESIPGQTKEIMDQLQDSARRQITSTEDVHVDPIAIQEQAKNLRESRYAQRLKAYWADDASKLLQDQAKQEGLSTVDQMTEKYFPLTSRAAMPQPNS